MADQPQRQNNQTEQAATRDSYLERAAFFNKASQLCAAIGVHAADVTVLRATLEQHTGNVAKAAEFLKRPNGRTVASRASLSPAKLADSPSLTTEELAMLSMSNTNKAYGITHQDNITALISARVVKYKVEYTNFDGNVLLGTVISKLEHKLSKCKPQVKAIFGIAAESDIALIRRANMQLLDTNKTLAELGILDRDVLEVINIVAFDEEYEEA